MLNAVILDGVPIGQDYKKQLSNHNHIKAKNHINAYGISDVPIWDI